jgi:hypothetical protein
VHRFGWCVAQAKEDGNLQLRASGIKSDAAGAVTAALKEAANFGKIRAAAIDSPLFWVADGDRKADKLIRSAMKRVGAMSIGGVVQHVNALRGACLSQGIMAAHLLRRELPEIRITKSHPKALLWLLRVASVQRPVAHVDMGHLGDFIESESPHLLDHERDAALGALAAWAMMCERSGWRDLYRDEEKAFAPVSPVEDRIPVGEIAPEPGTGGDGASRCEGR